MARKALIDSIIKLYQKLGGNVSEIMGTRTNVNFIGKGEPEMLKMDINPEALGVVPQSKAIEELKDSVQYAAGDKLNDIQASKLLQNMSKMDEFYNPPPGPANIADLRTGVRNLDREGLASLRLKADDYGYVSPDDMPPVGSRGGKDDIAAPFGVDLPEGIDAAETILPTGRGLEALKNVKNNNLIVNDLVDKIYDMSGVSKAAQPVARGNARDFLNTIKDLEDPTNRGGPTLSGVMEADDFKFMTEGGGGGMGDPLLLVQKYFGPRVAASVAQLKNRDEIELFARRLVRIKDGRGRSITDRDFNPDDVDIDTVDVDLDFADGGPVREGYMAGALVRGARMGYQALRKYGFEAKDISKMFRDLAMDKSLQGKEKTLYFKTLNKALKNPEEFPDTIKEMQIKLGIDVGTGFRNGGLAGILEV